MLVLNHCTLRQNNGATAAALAFTKQYQGAGDMDYGSSFTFSSVSIGAASTNRVVLIYLTAEYGNNAWSVTFDGASPDYSLQIASSKFVAYKAISSGTTTTIAWSGQSNDGRIEVCTITGTSGTHTDVQYNNSTVNEQSVTLNIPTNGIGVGLSLSPTQSTDPNLLTTWTGMTRVGPATLFDASGDDRRISWASSTTPGATTSVKYKPLSSGSCNQTLWAISFA
ncbi:MAG TPA: hypothetical protein PLF26_13065 [Blastocatellia bacterium]|nr:hypothetical protein [Blastocatellia bacterium]